MYAYVWTKIVWLDAIIENEDSEDNDVSVASAKEIHGAVCTKEDWQGSLALQFTWKRLQASFAKNDRYVLSRTSPEVDGNFKCVMMVDHIEEHKIVTISPRRIPPDITNGSWRLTAMPKDHKQAYRMCRNIKRLVHGLQNEVMSKLLCIEDLARQDVEYLNTIRNEPNGCWETLLQHYSVGHRLNSTQRAGMEASTNYVITLIQGPPGTGKSSTSVAILAMHAQRAKLIAVAAPSNHAVDELMERLCKQDNIKLPILRLGLFTSSLVRRRQVVCCNHNMLLAVEIAAIQCANLHSIVIGFKLKYF